MLQLLRDNYLEKSITLTAEFKRDLQWFKKILNTYNGTSIYNHAVVRHTFELDACLTGFGAVSGNYVYHLKIDRGYGYLNIVHLEMLNILLALRTFAPCWTRKQRLIKGDNEEVVKVLNTGRAYDLFGVLAPETFGFKLHLWTLILNMFMFLAPKIKQLTCFLGEIIPHRVTKNWLN